MQGRSDGPVAESITDFFELFVRTLTSGDRFSKLSAEQQVAVPHAPHASHTSHAPLTSRAPHVHAPLVVGLHGGGMQESSCVADAAALTPPH